MAGVRFNTSRFHVLTGPTELFDRVKQKMTGSVIKLHAAHLRQRLEERDIPEEIFESFSSETWELMTVEVRNDSGKFVSSAWRCQVKDTYLWIVIGLHNTVQTAMFTDKKGLGNEVVREGSFYKKVQIVNKELLGR